MQTDDKTTPVEPSLLTLGSEEGGTIRLRSLPDGRLELRVTSQEAARISNNNLDRGSAILIRDAITRWLGGGE